MRWHAHKPSGKGTEVNEQWLKETFEENFSEFLNSLHEDENVNVRLLAPQGIILKNGENNQLIFYDVKMKHHNPDE